jgi:hypothetical protein
MDVAPIYDPSLTRDELDAITSIIAAIPSINHRILHIATKGNKSVVVRTGEIRGPRHGSGSLVTLERDGSDWKTIDVSGWIS